MHDLPMLFVFYVMTFAVTEFHVSYKGYWNECEIRHTHILMYTHHYTHKTHTLICMHNTNALTHINTYASAYANTFTYIHTSMHADRYTNTKLQTLTCVH